jgi:hypothetical protein
MDVPIFTGQSEGLTGWDAVAEGHLPGIREGREMCGIVPCNQRFVRPGILRAPKASPLDLYREGQQL